jgi:hypothetical protein
VKYQQINVQWKNFLYLLIIKYVLNEKLNKHDLLKSQNLEKWNTTEEEKAIWKSLFLIMNFFTLHSKPFVLTNLSKIKSDLKMILKNSIESLKKKTMTTWCWFHELFNTKCSKLRKMLRSLKMFKCLIEWQQLRGKFLLTKY